MSSPEAGPSTAPAQAPPVFKKRGKLTGAATSRISRSVIDDEQPPPTSLHHGAGQEAARDDDDDDEQHQISVQDLIALRSLSRKPTGIELERLNQGEKKKRKTAQPTAQSQTQEERWAQQMKRGGLVGNNGSSTPIAAAAAAADGEGGDSDDEASSGKPRRLVRKNNFQLETGTVDVDKHMMAYIESEMAKRTGASSTSTTAIEASTIQSALANPHDQLYTLAEEYRQLQRSLQPQQTQEEREGNVALSAAMLTSIPEVDLGIDSRMKTIQQTEAAKRSLLAKTHPTNGGLADDEAFASARFQYARPRPNADATRNGGERKHMATDQAVLDRFKKRQRNFR
ncbi:hypothetical protein EX895_003173 [Sporisorium graminicola]|uniref:Hepatocellular carcinoma-associated antigen 59-domain-containing protein n=1 Tax=Sporisorium graminicola TaxID=280036 RepID=A0A4U7KVA8_9BASI|nr:hypothetical protein EX895_003173 [Sporisorium graminicola]TKY88077.1 hypothetical protein EX895_003173 [Sporisorium graminicola]